MRERFEELAAKPKRRIGVLAHLGPVGDPVDGWGPMSEEKLGLWKARDEGTLP